MSTYDARITQALQQIATIADTVVDVLDESTDNTPAAEAALYLVRQIGALADKAGRLTPGDEPYTVVRGGLAEWLAPWLEGGEGEATTGGGGVMGNRAPTVRGVSSA